MIYDNIVEYCNKKKISIAEFERFCNISNGSVRAWKNNEHLPNLNVLLRIKEATKRSIDRWVD